MTFFGRRVLNLSSILDLPHNGQLLQDVWVVAMTGGKRHGRFLEIGSSDGVHLNNTLLLEREFEWRGCCVEPNPDSFAKLEKSRTAKCFRKAVWKVSGEKVRFIARGVLGAIEDVAYDDLHAPMRKAYAESEGVIEVETISVQDLMAQSGLPPWFDYLSLDVEGAELEAIKNFDLGSYKFALGTIEHNGHSNREEVFDLLVARGYERANVKWEDWYWHPEVFSSLNNVTLDHARQTLADVVAYVNGRS